MTTSLNSNGPAGDVLLSYRERIERLHEEKKALEEDIKEVYAEARANGYDTNILRELMKRHFARQKDRDALQEKDTLIELYEEAVRLAEADRQNRR